MGEIKSLEVNFIKIKKGIIVPSLIATDVNGIPLSVVINKGTVHDWNVLFRYMFTFLCRLFMAKYKILGSFTGLIKVLYVTNNKPFVDIYFFLIFCTFSENA